MCFDQSIRLTFLSHGENWYRFHILQIETNNFVHILLLCTPYVQSVFGRDYQRWNNETFWLSVFATAITGFIKPIKLFLKLSTHKPAHNAQHMT